MYKLQKSTFHSIRSWTVCLVHTNTYDITKYLKKAGVSVLFCNVTVFCNRS